MKAALRRESFRELQAIDAVHPVEAFGDGTRLVSLQAADEMPGEPGGGERVQLGQAFLQEILAKIAHARGRGRGDCCAALALRNRQKRDRIDSSTRGARGSADAFSNAAERDGAILRTG